MKLLINFYSFEAKAWQRAIRKFCVLGIAGILLVDANKVSQCVA